MARWFLVIVVAACGGGGGGGGGDDGGGGVDAPPAEPLTCKSIALCTTFEVKTFLGTPSTPAGGALGDGIYKLAYKLIPDDIGESGGYHDELEALEIRGDQFNWAGFFRDEVGTVTVAGTKATFQATRRCSRGTDTGDSTDKQDYPFTASAGELHLFSHVTRSDGVQWDEEQVYLRVGDPQQVCAAVANEPSTPGDSVQCTVSNCACSFAIEDTVGECT